MRTLNTIPSLSIKSGGPALSVSRTVRGLQNIGWSIELLTYHSDLNIDWEGDKNSVHYLSPVNNHFLFSRQFRLFLNDNRQYDLYHCQGVWQYPTMITSYTARKYKKPYIITPRGMLYPQALNHSKWIKKLMLEFSLKRDLQKSACVHATCVEEMQHIRNLGITSPIAVIPNPIEIQTVEIERKEKLRVGYLGRVHPRKNIERLIYVWDKLVNSVSRNELVIIGDGDEKYMQFLKDEAKRLNLKNVLFTGFLSGKAKEDALQSLSYLVVPSDFENFGMIVPEALQYGIPVIASKGMPWEDLCLHQCGWWVDNDVETLTQTMQNALSLSEEERCEMGKRGQQLIKGKYSVEVVSQQMSQLYDWILNGGEKPEFVYLK